MWWVLWLFEIEMEDNRLGYQDVFEVLLNKRTSEAVSVYSIPTFSRSNGVNVAIYNLVNC